MAVSTLDTKFQVHFCWSTCRNSDRLHTHPKSMADGASINVDLTISSGPEVGSTIDAVAPPIRSIIPESKQQLTIKKTKKKVITKKELKQRLQSFKKRIADRLDQNWEIVERFVDIMKEKLQNFVTGMTIDVIDGIDYFMNGNYVVKFMFPRNLDIEYVKTCYILGQVLENRFVVKNVAIGNDYKTEMFNGSHVYLLRLLSIVNFGVSQEIFNHINDIFRYARMVGKDGDCFLDRRFLAEPTLHMMNGELVLKVIELKIVVRKVDNNYKYFVGKSLDDLKGVDNVFQAYEDYMLPLLFVEV
jgi:hypothetical protein